MHRHVAVVGRLRRGLKAAALLACGLLAPAAGAEERVGRKPPPRSAAEARPAEGNWTGSYTCGQGLTAVSLTIAQTERGTLAALFHFHAHPDNPGVPAGCFVQAGRFDAETGRVTLRGRRWLVRPADYAMVGFVGTLDRASGLMTGRVIGPGCTRFTLSRRVPPSAVPQACRMDAVGALD